VVDAGPPPGPDPALAAAVVAALGAGGGVGLVVQDRAGRILSADATASRLTGATAAAAPGTASEAAVGAGLPPGPGSAAEESRAGSTAESTADLAASARLWRTVGPDGGPWPAAAHPTTIALRTGRPQRDVLLGVRSPAGDLRWLSVDAVPVPGAAATTGAVPAVVTSFRDVTARHAAERRLRESEQHYRAIALHATDLITRHGPDGRCEFASPAAARVLGVDPEELLGAGWTDRSHPDDLAALQENRRLAVDTGGTVTTVHRLRHAHGRWVWLETTSRGVPGTAGAGTGTGTGTGTRTGAGAGVGAGTGAPVPSGEVQSASRDITDRRETQEELARLALHDGMTGLANRTLFADRLRQALARLDRRPARLALLLVDLDRFKQVNDTLGHQVGDALLVEVARRLLGQARTSDTVARLGGDEFVVLVDDLRHPQEAEVVAARITDALRLPYDLPGVAAAVGSTASVGVAVTDRPGTDPDHLFRQADLAMYRAKRGGGDGHAVYDGALHDRATERHGTERLLRHALDSGRLALAYEPVVELATGRLVGAHAAVRVVDEPGPAGDRADAGRLRRTAEETGLVVELDRWAVGEAAAQAGRWRSAAGPGLEHLESVTVPLAAATVQHPRLPEWVVGALHRHGLPGAGLRLDLGGAALLRSGDGALRALALLHEAGVRLGADDLGTGQAALSALQRVRLCSATLGRPLVADLPSPRGTAVARAVVDLAHALGLTVVAEGVETAEQQRALVRLGCERARGPWWSPAVPADALAGTVHGVGPSPR